MSFYIPYVPNGWDEESIRGVFSNLSIGLVDRVDFFDTGNWSHDGTRAWALSAFVHLKYWSCSHYSDLVYDGIQTTGQWKLYIHNQPGKYFVLRKMTCEKIPATHLNVHQLAAKMTEMEREIQELRTALIATRVAEDVLRGDSMDLAEEDTDFYNNYEDSGRLSMAEMVDQTQEFQRKMGYSYSGVPMDVDSDTSSQGSAKRMRVSEELCGNN